MKERTFLIPRPVYEILPTLYIGLGLISIFLLSSRLAVTSGLVLILIGGLLIVQRRNYRSDSQAINQHQTNEE